jgi:thioredoxin reductase (NADPH)
MDAPILLVVDEDPAVLEALSDALGRRFAADYRILAEPSPASALTVLEQLAASSRPVALVLAGQQMTGTSGVELLEAAHRLHPSAKRVLRLERGDYTAANPAVRAMTLGQIDYHLFTPWLPAERWLYPPVSDFLADWSKTQPPSFASIRVVGHQWEPRSHQLRDILTRLAFPYRFFPDDSEAGRQLLTETGQDGSRLPVLVFRTGQVLVDPSHAELVELLGASTRPEASRYDLAIVGAGPAGLAAAVSAASEGLRTLVVEPEVFGGQAGTSSLIRNYPGFPPRHQRRRPGHPDLRAGLAVRHQLRVRPGGHRPDAPRTRAPPPSDRRHDGDRRRRAPGHRGRLAAAGRAQPGGDGGVRSVLRSGRQ